MTATEMVGAEGYPPSAPTKKQKKRPPVEHVDKPKEVNLFEGLPTPEAAAEQVKSPYPVGIEVFTYQPNDESAAPILLPTSGFQPGDKLWHFDLAQLPILAQTWKWMDRANVPKAIQRQAQLLDDSEYFAMFNKWFDVMKQGQAPKGSVTAGK